MKIAFVSLANPYNRNARSGVPYSIFKELSVDNQVEWIFPTKECFVEKFLWGIGILFERIIELFNYHLIHNSLISRVLCHSIQRKIENKDYDCVFTMGSLTTAYLKCSLPIFCRADAIAHSMIDYYYFGIPQFAQKMAKKIDELALHKYTRFFVPSQWVVDEINKFNINEPIEKFPLIETGANLDSEYIQYHKHSYSTKDKLNLLFVGYDLKRKGIDEAFGATKILREEYGIDACLVIMGGKPEKYILESGFVRYAGKKDKNIKQEFDEFYNEFVSADLFIFPTKAECHGIVNCEAAAYGLPIFSYQTGGVPSYCIDRVNGRCMPTTASSQDFAQAIFEAIKDGSMAKYSLSSRRLYEERFNWAVWGQKARKEMKKAMKNN